MQLEKCQIAKGQLNGESNNTKQLTAIHNEEIHLRGPDPMPAEVTGNHISKHHPIAVLQIHGKERHQHVGSSSHPDGYFI